MDSTGKAAVNAACCANVTEFPFNSPTCHFLEETMGVLVGSCRAQEVLGARAALLLLQLPTW